LRNDDADRGDGEIVGTLIGVYLNDSVLSRLSEFGDERAKQRDFFANKVLPALSTVVRMLSKTPFCCAPGNVALCRPIPLLTDRHGLRLALFDYQRRCVRYMLDVERKSRSIDGNVLHVPTTDNVVFRHVDSAFLPNAGHGRNGSLVLCNLSADTLTLKLAPLDVRGGVLAAKTGSGKTTTTIALIYLQHCFDAALGVERRGRTPSDGPQFPLHRLPPLYAATVSSVMRRFYTPATLVVAPRQVVQQWADEFRKTLVGAPLRVHTIRGASDAAAMSIYQVMTEVDVLIVNKALFKSSAYRAVRVTESMRTVSYGGVSGPALKKKKYSYWPGDDAFINEVVRRDRDAVASGGADGSGHTLGSGFDGLLLHAMHFQRIIIDEAHELDSRWSMTERAVAGLHSSVTWLLTATPNFDSQQSFSTHNREPNTLVGYPALIRAAAGALDLTRSERVRWYFAQRNCITASTVVGMPPLVLHRRDVRLDVTEMAIYMSISSQNARRQVEFCSHHNVDDEHWQALLRNASSDDNDEETDLERHLSVDRAMGVEQVAESMQSGRKRRLEQLKAHIQAEEAAIISSQDAVLQPLLQESELLRELWAVHPNRLDMLYGALALRTITVQRVDTVARRLALAAESDSSRAVVGHGDNNKDDNDDGGGDDDDDDDDNDRENFDVDLLSRYRAAAAEIRLRQQQVLDRLEARELDTALANVRKSAADVYQVMTEVRERRQALQAQRQQLHNVTREHNFFDGVLRRLVVDPAEQSEPLSCPICLDGESMQRALALTACGHEFCCECAKQHFAKHAVCPICRQRLRLPDDLRNVDRMLVVAADHQSPPPKDAAKDDGDATSAAAAPSRRYGSKIDALLRLIGEIRERGDFAKMIVYAQFERLLALVATALREFGLQFEYARGSIMQCEKAIRRFKNDEGVRILLLSSERSISGVHLVEANHLVAIHPPLGYNVEQAYSMHWQAIGRIRRLVQTRTCHVWSLVTRGTIEQDMFEQQVQHARVKHANEDNIDWSEVAASSGNETVAASSVAASVGVDDVRSASTSDNRSRVIELEGDDDASRRVSESESDTRRADRNNASVRRGRGRPSRRSASTLPDEETNDNDDEWLCARSD